MKKILFCIIGCFMVLPLGADNVTTTKPYVDYHVGQKQDKIPGIPSEYTPVEYIQSSGVQYIDTGVTPTSSYKVSTKIKTLGSMGSGVKMVYGARTAYKNKGFALQYWTKFYLQYNTADTGGNITPTTNTVYEIEQNGKNVYINGTTLSTTGATAATFAPTASMAIFGVNSDGTVATTALGSFKLYYFTMRDASGTLKFNGIPVKYNNVCGLYDTVSKTFKPSNSGTAFTCGPVGVREMVTYGASAGDIGSKMIVSSLGTDTTESTIPTTGAMVGALDDKMGTVGAGAGFVMAGEIVGGGTSTAHAKKPVYSGSGTNRYNDALVTATVVNNNARSAANNELSCLDHDCTLWRIGSAAQLNTTCKASDVPCINSDECCSNSCVLGQCFAACVPSGGSCSQNSECCSGLQCLFSNKCGTIEIFCTSDSDCSKLTTPYCCNKKCQATECADTLCAEQGVSCESTPCCAGLVCNNDHKPPVCEKKSLLN